MMDLGRFKLGDTVDLTVMATDASGTPLVLTNPPVVKVYDLNSTLVLNASMAALDGGTVVGLYHYQLSLGAEFQEGACTIDYTWTGGGPASDTMTIIPSGSFDGAITSMYFFRRPQANFIIQGLGSGKLVMGKNPAF